MENENIRHYKSAKFCPVWNYEMVIENNDLRYLLKLKDYEYLPEYEQIELQEHWENICNEYAELQGSSAGENDVVLSLQKAAIQYRVKHDYVMNLLNILAVNYADKEVLDDLKKAGYKIIIQKSIPEQIENIRARIKQFISMAEMKEHEAKELQEQNDNGNVSTFSIADIISDYKKRTIDLKKVTLTDWVIIIDNYKKAINGNSKYRDS